MNICILFVPNVHFGLIIWLLRVWSTDQQQWHYLELVRNAEYQPPFDTESEFAF